ncbi:MAG: DEAD/DEAH box helicase [Thermomicrobiales bacterium]
MTASPDQSDLPQSYCTDDAAPPRADLSADLHADDTALSSFRALYPFPLDPFQEEAIGLLRRGESVMVAAPTGTGKTVVAEYAVHAAFARRARVMYTTPIKALSNQKFRDLRARYGDAVGLLTGDVTVNPRAPILVMTTEVVRNMLIQAPWEMDTVDAIIFDEIHFLADPERGTTWEEAIILCPEHIQLVCLSATVSNAQEIAAWIGRTHRPIHLITHDERAVPLALYYYLDGTLHLVLDRTGRQVADFPDIGGEYRRAYRGQSWEEDALDMPPERDEPTPTDIVLTLQRQEMLPAIYFQFSRKECEVWAQHAAAAGVDVTTSERTVAIEAIIEGHLRLLAEEDRQLSQVVQIIRLARRGIGYHHAGLLPILKQLVETLFTGGLMHIVYATDTLALGVNMPARTCVIGRLTKWDGRRRRLLIPNEFQQMSGRAGRRGMDALGHVVMPYSARISFTEMLQVATGALHPVRSGFSVRYNTVLNLWDPPAGERVRQLLSQSLLHYQTNRRVRDTEMDLMALEERIATVSKGCLLGYESGDDLLDEYRALGRGIKLAETQERRAREDETRVLMTTDDRPWKEPTRHVLRQVFRTLPVGAMIHVRDKGWGVYLGRPADATRAAIGRFLFGLAGMDAPLTIDIVSEYRQIDHLPSPDAAIILPPSLVVLPEQTENVAALLAPSAWNALRSAVAALGLPDLDAWLVEFRAARRLVQREDLEAARDATHTAHDAVLRLTEQQRAHVCDACPVRDEHRRNLGVLERLTRERQIMADRAAQESQADDAQTRNLIRGIAAVLHQFGYLQRGYTTPKADLLADIFDNNAMVVAELVDRGWLDELAPEDIAEVFSWFAYDRDARFENTFELPRHLTLVRERLDDLTHGVLVAERRAGLTITTGYHPLFYGALRAWCRGAVMERIVEKVGLSEGDVVLAFNKSLDIMRQVRTMLQAVRPESALIEQLTVAEQRVRRGIVEQSYSIGIMPVPIVPASDDTHPVLEGAT